jgi:competence protein ComEA
MPAGPGRELILRACIGCHKQETFTQYRHSREEFKEIVYRMAEQRRAQATAAELDTIADYLATNFTKIDDPDKVNVNKADAKEIQARLGLTQKEADAVVDYRGRHGNYTQLGDLYLIYGVDGKKIEALKDKISF